MTYYLGLEKYLLDSSVVTSVNIVSMIDINLSNIPMHAVEIGELDRILKILESEFGVVEYDPRESIDIAKDGIYLVLNEANNRQIFEGISTILRLEPVQVADVARHVAKIRRFCENAQEAGQSLVAIPHDLGLLFAYVPIDVLWFANDHWWKQGCDTNGVGFLSLSNDMSKNVN